MIYVTQGHERGIGLEVFLKSFLCFTGDYQKKFVLVSFIATLKNHQNFFDIEFIINDDHLLFADGTKLQTVYLTGSTKSTQTTESMLYCLKHITSNDILLTLPSSKDQFFHNKKSLSGHTEFLRSYYNNSNIGMSFLAEDSNVLLLTDHIALDEVIESITKERIIQKFTHTLKALNDIRVIKEVYFSGINPHCGEDGIISCADRVITDAITKLRLLYPSIIIHNMHPGDTIHFHMRSRDQLFVYTFHDQGLAPFKLKYGLSGINFTTGLTYKRVSVDHGTSFNLYGKNLAEYSGMNYLLAEIKNWL